MRPFFNLHTFPTTSQEPPTQPVHVNIQQQLLRTENEALTTCVLTEHEAGNLRARTKIVAILKTIRVSSDCAFRSGTHDSIIIGVLRIGITLEDCVALEVRIV